MKCFIWFILLILAGCHSAQERNTFEASLARISSEDQQKLETLFHHMMTSDYFAGTLFGDKPVTFQEFYDDPWKMPSCCMVCPSYHFYMDEGWKTWNNNRSLFPSERFNFAKIPSKAGYAFVILINKESFREIFDKNRDLFQQVLGSQITVEKLFHDFEKGQKTFSEVLNEHEGLVGIVLGYGREASLLAHRDNALSNEILSMSLHPLTPSFEHNELVSMSSRTCLKSREKKLSRQGIRWHQLGSSQIGDREDPYMGLNESKGRVEFFHPTWEELIVHILSPNFTCIKNSVTTLQLRNDYDESMRSARKAFRDKSFLRGFLEKYCEE